MECNTPFYKEFMILIMGPISQNIAYFLLCFFFSSSIVYHYHMGILFFNLLPIYPLDGGKLLHLVMTCFIPYRRSFQLSILIYYPQCGIHFFLI